MKIEYEERLKKYKCPLCKADLKIVKVATKTGGEYSFIGCSRFPDCRFSTSIKTLEEWIKNKTEKNQDSVLDSSLYLKSKYDIDLPTKLSDLLLDKGENGNGFVYFIRKRNDNLVKIGKTTSIISRLCSLDKELDGIIPVWIIKTKFYSAMEMFFHEVFKKFLVEKNEYFKIPIEYLIEVSKIKIFLGEEVEVVDKFHSKELIEALERKRMNKSEHQLEEDIKQTSK